MSDSALARRERGLLLVFGVIMALLALVLQSGADQPLLLYIAPLLALIAVHGCDAGPGRRLLAVLGQAEIGTPAGDPPPRRLRRDWLEPLARGGELISTGLAGRGPPVRLRRGPTSPPAV